MAISLWPVERRASARTTVRTAILSATPLRIEVNNHWRETRTFPRPRAAVVPLANAPARVELAARGRIVIVVDAPEIARIHGKRIEFVPKVVEDDGRHAELQWSCRADGIESRDLPLNCR